MLSPDFKVFQDRIVFNSDGNAIIIAPVRSMHDLVLNANQTARTARTSESALELPTSNKVQGNETATAAIKKKITSGKFTAKSKVVTKSSGDENKSTSIRPYLINKSTSPHIHSFRIVNAEDATTATCATARKGETWECGPYDDQQKQSYTRHRLCVAKKCDPKKDSNEFQIIQNDNDRQCPPFKISKPILMCFLCKLSFGNTTLFSSHASSEHNLTLQLKEQNLLSHEYSSVIIQPPNIDECPQLSFLEPIGTSNEIKNKGLNIEADVKLNDMNTIEEPVVQRLFDKVEDDETGIAVKAKTTVSTSQITSPLKSTSEAGYRVSHPSMTVISKVIESPLPQITASINAVGVFNICNNKTLLKINSFAESVGRKHQQEKNNTSTINTLTDIITSLPSMSNQFSFSNKRQHYRDRAQETPTNTGEITSSVSNNPTEILAAQVMETALPESVNDISSKHIHSILSSPKTCDLEMDKLTTVDILQLSQKSCDEYKTEDNSLKPKVTLCDGNSTTSVTSKSIDHPNNTYNLENRDYVCSLLPFGTKVEDRNLDTLEDAVVFESFKGNSPTSLSSTLNGQSFSRPCFADITDDSNSTTCSTTEETRSSAKQVSDLLQHYPNLRKQHQQVKQEYPAVSGNLDCKNYEVQQPRSPYLTLSTSINVISTTPKHSPERSDINSTSSKVTKSPQKLVTSSANVSKVAKVAGIEMSENQQKTATAIGDPIPSVDRAVTVSLTNSTSSFTIGACSDHKNGRPLGVECVRCEIILNSTRLNSGVQMSTRNSCKTLKCPQCNWHYKYQETLEIHMREKHPDGESACGYCLSGQQHPRLARGESYSCGYKPYRCEICNYSTTTKGNLSIHMQSDKHLNNMQELSSSQNILAAAVAAANNGSTNVTSKILLSNNIVQQRIQQQQTQPHQTLPRIQSDVGIGTPSVGGSAHINSDNSTNICSKFIKGKPSFRCDICSYETSVARNLRIHMSSEKHTQNMATFQNNINHIQAYSYLQHQQQAFVNAASQQKQQSQQKKQYNVSTQGMSQLSPLGSTFLPEMALTDLTYNQALMLKVWQQNNTCASQSHLQQEYDPDPQLQPNVSPLSSPRPMQVTQSYAKEHIFHGEKQTQQNYQNAQQSNSPSCTSPLTILPAIDSFGSNEVNLSSNFGSSCTGDEIMEPPIRIDPYPTKLYSCLICDIFNSDSLNELNQHLLVDRSRIGGTDGNSVSTSNQNVLVVLNNNYICRLCNYKTTLKANFQLHSKTDKHLQKLNYINHIREGGPHNEYKLNFLQLPSSTVQLKCNCCDFYTNSMQKLSLHSHHMQHEAMRVIYQHLLNIMQQQNFENSQSRLSKIRQDHAESEIVAAKVGGDGNSQSSANMSEGLSISSKKALMCLLCNYSTFTLVNMIQHIKSQPHMQVEQYLSFQGQGELPDLINLGDIFKLVEKSSFQSLPCLSAAPSEGVYKILNGDNISVSTCFPTPSMRFTNESFPFDTSLTDPNSISPSSGSSSTSGNTSACSKIYPSDRTQSFQNIVAENEALALIATAGHAQIPSVVFKCNNCAFFAQSKQDMELHLISVHPQNEPDYISIPTNSATIQALQQAVAAATAAASAVSAACSESNKQNSENSGIDSDSINLFKRECLYSVDGSVEKTETTEKAPQDTSTKDPLITSTINTIASFPSLNETTPSKQNIIEHEEIGKEEPPQKSQLPRKTGNVINNTVQCPLCTNTFEHKQTMQTHVMNVHCVNHHGLDRLLKLVDSRVWQKSLTTSNTHFDTKNAINSGTLLGDINTQNYHESILLPTDISKEPFASFNSSLSTTKEKSSDAIKGTALLSCQQCSAQLENEQQLLQHAQKMQHFITLPNGDLQCLGASHPIQPCLSLFPTKTSMIAHYIKEHLSVVISERHVYKYRCKHCSLAFKTEEKLFTHLLYHTMRNATKCTLCQRNFRSTKALRKHIDDTHNTTDFKEYVSSSPAILGMATIRSPDIGDCPDLEKAKSNDSGSVTTINTQNIDVHQFFPTTPDNKDQQFSTNASQLSTPLISHILEDQQSQNQCNEEELITSNTFKPAQIKQSVQITPRDQTLLQRDQQQQIPNLKILKELQPFSQLTFAKPSVDTLLNPVEILNIMQFQHIMSMNFMNLAPPLIFGANANVDGTTGSADLLTSSNKTSASQSTFASKAPCSADIGPHVPVGVAVGVIGTIEHQHQLQKQCVESNSLQVTSNQKRSRTRITDDQLKILRTHFDINNSPSEESIMEMSQKTKLPMKVVKHWFRNTLFKERQRNKDSPYNFNNPPSTTLNLEEYERTGQATIASLNDDLHLASLNLTTQQKQKSKLQDDKNEVSVSEPNTTISHHRIDIKTEVLDDRFETTTEKPQHQQKIAEESSIQNQQNLYTLKPIESPQKQGTEICEMIVTPSYVLTQSSHGVSPQQSLQLQQQQNNMYTYETKSESGSSDILSRPSSPNNYTAVSAHCTSITDLLDQKLNSFPLGQNVNITSLNGNNMGPPKKFQINKSFDKNSPSLQFDTNSNSSNASSSSSGKRANRTRFTDHQIKVLQEFFENNSYPKDSDLEYLSKLLLLSPRVIVVWFQNARQKQRKIYENQPNNSMYETEEKKHSISYTCKKCNLAFQRYYELIRHQKNHCFKDENNKRSAKAQIAAAHLAQSFSSEDSNSSMDLNNSSAAVELRKKQITASKQGSQTNLESSQNSPDSPIAEPNAIPNTSQTDIYGKLSALLTDFVPSPTSTSPHQQRLPGDYSETHSCGSQAYKPKFECDKCKLQFHYFDHFREHQLLHLMNTGLSTSKLGSSIDSTESFSSILQSLQQQQDLNYRYSQPPTKKLRSSETFPRTDNKVIIGGDISTSEADKNIIAPSLSNTIKYDFLYQYFMENESNNEPKLQIQTQKQELHEPKKYIDFFENFHNQYELRTQRNYDILYQYYQNNQLQQPPPPVTTDSVGANKIHMEFLLQYYQLNESRKFFPPDASTSILYNEATLPTSTTQHRVNGDKKTKPLKDDIAHNMPETTKISLEVPTRRNIGLLDDCGDYSNNPNNFESDIGKGFKSNVDMNAHNTKSSVEDTVHIDNKNQESVENVVLKHRLVMSNRCESSDVLITNSKADERSHTNQRSTSLISTTVFNENSNTSMVSQTRNVYAYSFKNLSDTNKLKNPLSPSSSRNKSPVTEGTDAVTNVIVSSTEKQQNKRLRTTILPEQLNILYECYKTQANPSRKMLEEIAKKVNLKKRVVQ